MFDSTFLLKDTSIRIFLPFLVSKIVCCNNIMIQFCFVLVATTSCTFDYDLCGWTNLKNDQFDWSRRTGLTLAPGTGPSADHTSGSKFHFHLKAPSKIYSGL